MYDHENARHIQEFTPLVLSELHSPVLLELWETTRHELEVSTKILLFHRLQNSRTKNTSTLYSRSILKSKTVMFLTSPTAQQSPRFQTK